MVLPPSFQGLGLACARTYVHTDSHVTAKLSEIDGLPNLVRYGTPLARLRHAGAPLLALIEKKHYLSNFVEARGF